MDRGARLATLHKIAKSRTRLKPLSMHTAGDSDASLRTTAVVSKSFPLPWESHQDSCLLSDSCLCNYVTVLFGLSCLSHLLHLGQSFQRTGVTITTKTNQLISGKAKT